MEKTPILRVSNISKSFGGIKAIDGVSFDVKQKQIKALIGPNGAGKTTLFNIISGLYRPDSGEVWFLDKQLTKLKPFELALLGITRTFQNIRLVDSLTIAENIAVGLHTKGEFNPLKVAFGIVSKSEKAIFERVERSMRFLKIEDYAYKMPSEVPFGVKRLVELARAMVAEPKLILLDEPAAGLNETETDKLLNAIFRIWERGVSILLIEHDIEFVANCSHSVVVMDSGRKIAEGLPSEITNDDRVIKAYLGG
ncbi:ABC transporter ATP-binding protein [Hippea maritima]|uniref:Monosaccharide-transporting ATPase n=1 Tax=Hippea maritima (strain ATCC 700847 / DSM 10411 / MH2) TaxID=760142 RepID=F2LW40_HIPMA|nr:ABC transporter ATP-binding protein [Hippea maritima]AEA33974.1 Monosaccharide-transporting ATPase [Hippea maritima DSM 10411]